MSKGEKGGVERSILAQAAAGLELELRRFDELAQTVAKIPLDSQKNLERAAKTLNEVADSEERVNANVRALLDAIHGARERKDASALVIGTRASEIAARVQEFAQLIERLAALGTEASSINALVQELATIVREANDKTSALARIEEVQTRLGKAVDDAQTLRDAAKDKEATEIAQQADSIRQQMSAARNRLKLLAEKLSEAPS